MADITNYRDLVLLSAGTRVNSSNQLTKHAAAQLYKWATSAPSAPPNGTTQFTWATGVNSNYTGNDGWSTTLPANPGTPNAQLYVAQIAVTAYVGTDVSTVPYGSSNITALSTNGTNGTNGSNGTSGANVATVLIYQRTSTATAPERPTAATTFTFASGALAGLNNGWTSIIPTGTGAYLWVSTAVASGTGATDSIAASEWNVVQLLAQSGESVTGPRGAGRHYVTGNSWSDTVASAACPGGPTINDVVIIANGTNFVMEKVYNGSAWIQQANVYDGSLIVSKSITASKINSNGLEIRDTQGNLILGVGSALNDDYVPTSARNSQLTPAIEAAKNTSFWAFKHWDFHTSSEGWFPLYATISLANSRVTITPNSGSNDPILVSPSGLAVVGSLNDKVRARVRRTAGSGWDGNLYFDKLGGAGEGTLGSGFIGGNPCPVNQWVVLEWDMSAVAGWTSNTLNHIRIDLGNSPQDVFEVDWVSIGRYSVGAAQSEILNNQDSSVMAPEGGVYVGTTQTQNGALKIRLPQSWSSTMLKFTVDIFEYIAGYSCTLEIAGYNYNSGSSSQWHNATARVMGGSNVEYPVYFGHDGTRCCVWIGNASESWAYPQVRVRDVLLGYSNYTVDKWATGWQISFDTAAATNVTATITDTLPGADWSKIPNRAGRPEDNATYTSPSKGQALNDDPNFENANAWDLNSGITIATSGGLAGGSGTKFLSCGSGADRFATVKRAFAIDPAKVYNLTALLWATSGNNRNMYIFVDFFDYAGAQVTNTGWGGTKSGYTYGGKPSVEGWVRYGGLFGPGTGRNIPAAARTAKIGVWFQYSEGSSQVVQGAMDVRIEEATLAARALAELDAIASDSILSKGEKPDVVQRWNTCDLEKASLVNQASELGVSSTVYVAAHKSVSDYLVALNPSWSDVTKDSPIDPAVWKARWNSYHDEKQKLINAIAAKAATMANYPTVINRPQDSNNLVGKSSFEDGSVGLWSGSVVSVSGQPFTKALQTTGRDNFEEMGFPVSVGEKIYVEGWLDATGCNYSTYLGLAFMNAAGNYINWLGGIGRAAGQGWVFQKGHVIVPQNAVFAKPWFQISNDQAAAISGSTRLALPRISRFENGATVGATLGTNVSGSINDSNAANLVQISNLRIISSKLGNYSTPGTGGRMDFNDSAIKMYDGSNALMMLLGNSAA